MATTTKTMNHTEYQSFCTKQTEATLKYIIKDAGEALNAMPDNPNAGYYQDEIHYCRMELTKRKKAKELADFKLHPIKYEVEQHTSKSHVVQYRGPICQRTVVGGLTKKLANSIAYYLNDAYNQGRIDETRIDNLYRKAVK